MTKITTDFAGTETLAVTKTRLADILDFWNLSASGYTTWGDARTDLNALLAGTAVAAIGASERASNFRPKINLLNDPNAALVSFASLYAGTQLFVVDPDTVFTDTAGTTPAAFGEGVGGLRVPGGAVIATQATSDARPKYGRHPASGLRNIEQNNRADGAVVGEVFPGSGGTLPTGWTTSTASGSSWSIAGVGTENGLPYVDVRYTAADGTVAGAINFVASAGYPALNGQVWTTSGFIRRVAGSVANLSQIHLRSRWVGSTGSYQTGANIDATIDSADRRVNTHTVADGTSGAGTISSVQTRVAIGAASGGAVDITLRISGIQHELAAAASAVQLTRASGFDVTEDGQRSVYYLAPDGTDDWMEFVTSFTPAGAYTVAAARGFDALGTLSLDAGVSFGIAVSTARFFTRSTASSMTLRTNTVSNQIVSTGGFGAADGALRAVDLARVASASSGQMWRNGIASGGVTVTGDLTPLVGFDALLRRGAGYAVGRFYSGALIPAAITEPERLFLQRYLAGRLGVALA